MFFLLGLGLTFYYFILQVKTFACWLIFFLLFLGVRVCNSALCLEFSQVCVGFATVLFRLFLFCSLDLFVFSYFEQILCSSLLSLAALFFSGVWRIYNFELLLGASYLLIYIEDTHLTCAFYRSIGWAFSSIEYAWKKVFHFLVFYYFFLKL